MCVCVCVWGCVLVLSSLLCMYVCVCIYVCMYAGCVCACMYVYICLYLCVCIYTFFLCVCMYVRGITAKKWMYSLCVFVQVPLLLVFLSCHSSPFSTSVSGRCTVAGAPWTDLRCILGHYAFSSSRIVTIFPPLLLRESTSYNSFFSD